MCLSTTLTSGGPPDLLACPAGNAQANVAQHAKARRDVIQHLGDVLANFGLGPAATLGARAGLMLNGPARHVSWNRRATSRLARRFRFNRCRGVVVGRLGHLDLVKHQPQLRDLHLLGTAAERDAQRRAMFELLDLQYLDLDGGLGRLQFGAFLLHHSDHLPQYFLQVNRVGGKAFKVEPHARDYSGNGSKIQQKWLFLEVYRSCERWRHHFIVHDRVPLIQALDQHCRRCAGQSDSTITCPWPSELLAIEAFCIKA